MTTVRRAEILRAVAINAADFSDPELSELWAHAIVSHMEQVTGASYLRGYAEVWLGPTPFEVLAVDESADGDGANVVGCLGQPETLPPQRWPAESGAAEPVTYQVDRLEDGARRIMAVVTPKVPVVLPDGRRVDDEFCATVNLKRTVFSPPPDPAVLAERDHEDVVPPPTPTGRP